MTEPTIYQPGEFCWVDLLAHDMAAAKPFYGDVFGWQAIDQDTKGGPPYAQFQIGEAVVGGLGQMDDTMKGQGFPPCWNCYVQVESVDDTVAKATANGGFVVVQPMDVLDAGRLAFFAEPGGAVVGVWQPGTHCGASVRNVANTMCWHELATRNIEASKTFYAAVFGWNYRKHESSPSEYFVIDGGEGKDRGGLLLMTPEWGAVPPHWKVYFVVPSVTETVATIKAHGGQVFVEPFDTEVGPISIVADAQGAAFNLMQLGQSCK
ncbi:MAG: VOC family protein [Planctomycetes bacterium]|nr:VOC family protein [Planctomycetota bacterium]